MKKATGHYGVLTVMVVAAGEYGLEELTILINIVLQPWLLSRGTEYS